MADLTRIVLTIVYIILQASLISKIENQEEESSFFFVPGYVLILLTYIVWIRIISNLRIFKPTRALIRLLIEIIKDMQAFFSVVIVAGVAFAISLSILNYPDFHTNYEP